MSIRSRVILGLLIMLGFIAVQFFVTQYYERSMRQQVETAINKNFAAVDTLEDMSVLGQQLRRYEKEFFIYVLDSAGRTKYNKEWSEAATKLNNTLDDALINRKKAFSQQDVATISTWKEAADFYFSEFRDIMRRADAGQITGDAAANTDPVRAANTMIGKGKDRFRTLLDGADKMKKTKSAESTALSASILESFKTVAWIQLAVMVFGLALTIALIFWLPRAIARPIDALVGSAEKLSKGNLEEKFSAAGVSEFEGLASALERMRVTQMAMIDRLRGKPSQV